MITSLPCDQERHGECDGKSLVSGQWHPPNQPESPFRTEWITIDCDCWCHLLRRLVDAIDVCDLPYPDEERLAPLLEEARKRWRTEGRAG